ncbi:MOSC domain-containing protein 2, mitochondrial [Tetrabaena socialis]|uniref:MOSC domain-containing protein 2, mitochondrial n=1 Tax=Tetrabaena socialis TaxID=47790 RepID=A0A2J8A1P2_9CHLO|nr:MOSC domain-containing protein 2, mitochondrial [Tetrabaena socialis]|eukprot:PNH06437.1 MOSC domain-containing protein 2, mitochondrial [Tetrabaena socialis]
MPTVAALNVYPIKSCRGTSLQSAMMTCAGLAYDREWMVVRQETGRFISQRETSLLALVDVALPAEVLSPAQWGTQLSAEAALTVSAPGMPPLKVLMARRPDNEVRKVTVWRWTVAGADEGDDAAAWFSRYLGVAARLVRYLGSGGGVQQEESALADLNTKMAEPLPMNRFRPNIESALADLNTKMAEPLPMNRFRPNIELTGAEPWDQDSWRHIDIACAADGRTVRLTSVKPCSRCKITTTNQATGEVGDEPLDTLSTIRSGKVLGWNKDQKTWTHQVLFGWMVVSRNTGVLSVGDVLTVASPQLAVLTPAA